MDRRGGGPLRGDAAEAEARRLQVEARAAQIARSTGLPMADARRVALGQADVNALVQEMAVRDNAAALERRHALSHALAIQVARGGADLQQVLRRQRVDALLAEGRARTVLVPGSAWIFGVQGRRVVEARVTEVERYEVVLAVAEGAPERLHKLQLKYACAPDAHRKVRRAFEWDSARRAQPEVAPDARPQARWGIPDRRLGELVDARTPVTVTFLEGEMLTGEVVGVSPYEFTLRLRGGIDLTVFRHALAELRTA